MEQDGDWMLQLSSSFHWFSSGIGNKTMRNYLNHGNRNSEGNKRTRDEAGGVSAGLSGLFYCLTLGGEWLLTEDAQRVNHVNFMEGSRY